MRKTYRKPAWVRHKSLTVATATPMPVISLNMVEI